MTLAMPMGVTASDRVIIEEVRVKPSRQVRRRYSSSYVNADRKYRNRWKPTKPKRKRNRVTLSARVSRRHRKARG